MSYIYRNVTYLNARGSFVDENTIKAVDRKGRETVIHGENIVIAVGGRPRYPDVSAIVYQRFV